MSAFDVPSFGEWLRSELGETWLEKLTLASWNRARVEAEIETAGWQERLTAAGVAATEKQAELVAGRLRRTLESGPIALAGFGLSALAGMVKNTKLKALAESYAPFEHGGRLILGPTGVGKTVAGVAVCRRTLASPSAGASWVRALDLPNARLQQSLGSGEAALVSSATSAGFLVIDDLGWESKRAGADDVCVEVLATRYDRGLPTYVTSGLTRAAFIERYGDAIVRRIVEAGGLPGKVVDLWPR